MKKRSRELGIPFEGQPGLLDAITDVPGVLVGQTTLISGNGPLVVGKGPVRTGVTAILPRGPKFDPVFAGWYALNGNGEMTGTTWIDESGFLETPILLTNTHSIGVVHDATIDWMIQKRYLDPEQSSHFWTLPVVTETYDGRLNDVNGFHVHRKHVHAALDNAHSGPVAEGSTGGGAGMIAYQFKAGTGTASRVAKIEGDEEYIVGALVQANYGARERLTIAGVPVGREITDLLPEIKAPGLPPVIVEEGSGSIVVIIATNAPLLPHQLKRLARRVPMGIALAGGVGTNSSGDIFLAFSTANPGIFSRRERLDAKFLPNDLMTPLFEGVIHATEEAIVNSLLAADDMTGINGNRVYALPQDRLCGVLRKYNRL